MFAYTFWVFLLFFLFFFIIFISLFDEVSKFGNRILTNQKPKLLIRHYQWNCKLIATLNCLLQQQRGTKQN